MSHNLSTSDPAPRSSMITWVKRHRARLLFWLRLIVTIGLMVLVISFVAGDTGKFTDVNWKLIPVAGFLMLLSTVIKASRWRLLIHQSGLKISFRLLLEEYFIGAFFSTILPTSVGGDAIRAVDTAAKTGRGADATSSVLIERAIGLLTVAGAGSGFALFMEPGEVPEVFLLAVHLMFLAGIAGLIVLRQGWFIDPIAMLLTQLNLTSWAEKLRSLQAAFSEHLGHWALLLGMIVLSIIANTLTMGAIYLVLTAVTDPILLTAFVPMIALATTAELVPLSPAALGIKESAYVFFLGLVGVKNIDASVIAIIMRILVWGLAILGGAIYMVHTLRSQKQQPVESPHESQNEAAADDQLRDDEPLPARPSSNNHHRHASIPNSDILDDVAEMQPKP